MFIKLQVCELFLEKIGVPDPKSLGTPVLKIPCRAKCFSYLVLLLYKYYRVLYKYYSVTTVVGV